MCSFPLPVTALVWRRRHGSLSCLIFLSQFCGDACSVRWIPSLPLSPSPSVPAYWRRNCISTDTEWNEFGVYEMHRLIKGGGGAQQNHGDNLSCDGFSTFLLQLLSCIVAERLWGQGVILQFVGGGFKMCQGYQRRHVFVNYNSNDLGRN